MKLSRTKSFDRGPSVSERLAKIAPKGPSELCTAGVMVLLAVYICMLEPIWFFVVGAMYIVGALALVKLCQAVYKQLSRSR